LSTKETTSKKQEFLSEDEIKRLQNEILKKEGKKNKSVYHNKNQRGIDILLIKMMMMTIMIFLKMIMTIQE